MRNIYEKQQSKTDNSHSLRYIEDINNDITYNI